MACITYEHTHTHTLSASYRLAAARVDGQKATQTCLTSLHDRLLMWRFAQQLCPDPLCRFAVFVNVTMRSCSNL